MQMRTAAIFRPDKAKSRRGPAHAYGRKAFYDG
jgi:hypothetical protein